MYAGLSKTLSFSRFSVTVPVGVEAGATPTDAGTNSAVARVARRDLVVHPIDSQSLGAAYLRSRSLSGYEQWNGSRVLRRES